MANSKPKNQEKPIMANSEPTTALETLGTYILGDEARDAIHLAVVPIVATEKVYPGQHLTADGKTVGETVGICDPFLPGPVNIGQGFWLVLYPRTITSLRHAWTHPAFPEPAVAAPAQQGDRSYSEEWMRRWADEHVSADYYGDGEKVSTDKAYAFALDAGRENHIGPYEEAREHIDDEWWDHWEAITGEKGRRGEYFSCSC
jgi:hypothetical protein